jgi:hypothetical protein
MLEGDDSLEIVQALQKNGSCGSLYGQVVNETKMLLDHHDQVLEVNHVRRVANNAAHCLAKLALVQGEERIWRHDFPTCMNQIVLADL